MSILDRQRENPIILCNHPEQFYDQAREHGLNPKEFLVISSAKQLEGRMPRDKPPHIVRLGKMLRPAEEDTLRAWEAQGRITVGYGL